VEHRGIKYEVKKAIAKDEWVWIIHPPSLKQGKVIGPRDSAIYAAARAIDRWCYLHLLTNRWSDIAAFGDSLAPIRFQGSHLNKYRNSRRALSGSVLPYRNPALLL
jgi:hypothetical protein